MRKRIEFPLFELMLVVILLFFIVIFAFPKYMDVGSEARIKTLNAIALNIDAVNRLLYSRSLIKNVQRNTLQSTDVLGEKDAGAYLVYGELRSQKNDLKKFIDNELISFVQGNNLQSIRLYLSNYKNERCYIDYYQVYQVDALDKHSSIKRAYSRIKSTGC